jgi:Tol biopolymer transport system component
MKKMVIVGALLISACSSQTPEVIQEPVSTYTIEQFMDTKNIFGSSFSPDESKILISSNVSGVFNAYEINIASGEMTQVTNSDEDAVFAQGYFPNDERILFTSDRGGNELTSIYIRTTDGEATNITPDSTSKSDFGGWNKAKDKFYYVSNLRDPQFFDLYQVNVENQAEGGLSEAKVIYTNDKGMDPSAVSEDGRYIALTEPITTTNNNMHLFDTESKQMKLLSAHEGDVQYDPQYFSEDGTTLIFTTDEDSEFMHLRSYDIATGNTAEILQQEDWDIWYSYLSRNGTYRVTAINEDAKTRMEIIDTRTNQPVEIAGLPDGDITSVNISDSEKLMTFYASSSKSPSNLYIYNFETEELKKLTDTLSEEINGDDLVEGAVIRYASFDGMEIPALRRACR